MRRPFRKYIQRIDEMERMLRFMFEEIGRNAGCTITKNKVDEFLANDGGYKLDVVEHELQKLYSKFVRFQQNNEVLLSDKNHATEELEVVKMAVKVVDPAPADAGLRQPMLADDAAGLGFLAGVVSKAEEGRFTRMLWRASRGNTFVKLAPIDNKVTCPKTGQQLQKSVFVVYFQKGSTGSMKERIMKVCSAFGVNIYTWPTSVEHAKRQKSHLTEQLADKEKALTAFQTLMRAEIGDLLDPLDSNPMGNSKIEEWRLFCMKEKAIHNVLNQCEEGMALRVNVWYPDSDEASIQGMLKDERTKEGGQGAFLTPDQGIAAGSVCPTYFRTNEFTEPWQELVDTYGVPAYKEANPALLTTVTFPFIFGMMYGDVGHGMLLLLTGCWLVKNGESLRYTYADVFKARYVVLSLGFFAVYSGFLYNDFFSIGLPIFASGFEDPDGDGQWTPNYDVTNSGGPGPYPFGLDWAWAGATNELLYVNSLKMKLSVLFGVLQMIVGVFLRWSNALYFRNATDFIFECVPMMIFMVCFFGWMDLMIIYKWTHPLEDHPNIINALICMAMGQKDVTPLWEGSVELSKTLMMFTCASVPLMLLPKPFILLFQHNRALKKAASQPQEMSVADDEAQAVQGGGHGHGEEFQFDEILIHQIIETIEYVLGTVSHTASYLRIWALSLAHQQLSLVFFQKTLSVGLSAAFPMNGFYIFFMYAAWFGITLGVLMGMDVLECFLHTLRLHWVEFQSKFYKAGGVKFEPFSIGKLVSSANE